MPVQYTWSDILAALYPENGRDIRELYQEKCLNYKGNLKDDPRGRSINQAIIEELLEPSVSSTGLLDSLLNSILPGERNDYCAKHSLKKACDTKNHAEDTEKKDETLPRRLEERIALEMYIGNHHTKEIGDILDYQVPLAASKADKGIGKIDLVSYHRKRNILYLLELKRQDNPESLLRCILEILTYYQLVNMACLKATLLDREGNPGIKADAKVVPAVLIFENTRAAAEFENRTTNGIQSLLDDLSGKKVALTIFIAVPFGDTGIKDIRRVFPSTDPR